MIVWYYDYAANDDGDFHGDDAFVIMVVMVMLNSTTKWQQVWQQLTNYNVQLMMNSDANNIRDTCNRDDDNVHEVAQDYDDDAMDCDEVTVNEATWNYDEDNVDFAVDSEEAELASAMIDILHFSLLLRSHLCHICISISLQQEHL